MQSLDQLQQLLKDQPAQPPVDRWHPELSGDIDIRISGDGQWWHEGEPIQRLTLVKLFASILRREKDGCHYLVTPVEKWRVQVDDAPLLAVELREAVEKGERVLAFRLNTDQWLPLNADHPLQLRLPPGDGPAQPYLQLWRGLSAKLARPVYYQLAELAQERLDDSGNRSWWVTSCGQSYPLGQE